MYDATPTTYASALQAAATVYTMSPGRIGAIIAVVSGLIGAVIGARALARSSGTGNRRRRAVAASILGAISLIVGGLVVASADGGLGTGQGLGGGVVAMTVGLISVALGALALARTSRTS
jgi:hypothetical protein